MLLSGIQMRILLLADLLSTHTIKWACALADKDLEIGVFGLVDTQPEIYQDYPDISLFSAGMSTETVRRALGTPTKLRYLQALPRLKAAIQQFQPDILHAHFATSYGLLGVLSNFHPFILSVWGSDIFNFPHRSLLHKWLLQFNLNHADKILSTSYIMATETQKYTSKKIEVTPFGVDIKVFKPEQVDSLFAKDDLIIGTVKALEEIYGIEYLIKAFKILKEKYSNLPLKLLIIGTGSQETYLRKLVRDLTLETDVIFTGHVNHSQIPIYFNMMHVFVALSKSESFGVAAIEAAACGKPVVVSNVGGLPEVVDNEVTGFVVPPANPIAAAEAIGKLVADEKLREQMGIAGRAKVQKLYNWSDNVNHMISIYQNILDSK